MSPVFLYYSLVGVALLCGSLVFFLLARKANRPFVETGKIWLVSLFSSIFGAKIFHTLFEADGHFLPNGDVAQNAWELLNADPWHWARIFSPGYVLFGAIIFGSLAMLLSAKFAKVPNPLWYADFLAPAVTISLAIGRIGCFYAGCCYGNKYPVQLLEAAFGFMLFLHLMFGNFQRNGEKFHTFLTAYAVFRFFIEFLRDDLERGIWLGMLSTSQIISIMILLGFAAKEMHEKHCSEFSKLR